MRHGVDMLNAALMDLHTHRPADPLRHTASYLGDAANSGLLPPIEPAHVNRGEFAAQCRAYNQRFQLHQLFDSLIAELVPNQSF